MTMTMTMTIVLWTANWTGIGRLSWTIENVAGCNCREHSTRNMPTTDKKKTLLLRLLRARARALDGVPMDTRQGRVRKNTTVRQPRQSTTTPFKRAACHWQKRRTRYLWNAFILLPPATTTTRAKARASIIHRSTPACPFTESQCCAIRGRGSSPNSFGTISMVGTDKYKQKPNLMAKAAVAVVPLVLVYPVKTFCFRRVTNARTPTLINQWDGARIIPCLV
mmetsp:Transcript_10109/g.21714  ORF Transcript_10109/g.21714 Transcript_10109/m.21714 type:complete len:222 (-) Transcript_10109:1956-2621(-)